MREGYPPQRPIRVLDLARQHLYLEQTVPFEAVPYGRGNSGRPARWLLLGPYPILCFRLTELEEFQPLK